MAASMKIKMNVRRLNQIRDARDLAITLKMDYLEMQKIALAPRYRTYHIRKTKGGERLIEDPQDELKSIQFILNDMLQAAYLAIRPQSVYGFTIAKNDTDNRTIVGNALQHIGCNYLLNIDLKDFFHHVKVSNVDSVWKKQFRRFDRELRQILNHLVTYKGRLPMGAPTSPVLSNYASMDMDLMLIEYCNNIGLHYSRYADDLSFSSLELIHPDEFSQLELMIKESGFLINSDKVKWFGPSQAKVITGIIVDNKGLKLPSHYMPTLQKEVNRYRAFFELDSRYRTGASHKKLKLIEQEVRGKLVFASQIIPDDPNLINLYHEFEDVKNILEDYESVEWLDTPYNYF